MIQTTPFRPGVLRRKHRALRRSAPAAPPPRHGARHRILVVATTTDPSALAEEVRARTEEHDSDVVLICPALNSWLAHWVSDVDKAEAEARQRVEAGLAALVGAGVDAIGAIGDPDPLQAIADALAIHGADELVLATRPEHMLHRFERHLVERARARWAMPIEQLADASPLETPRPKPAPAFAEQQALLAELLEPERLPALVPEAAFIAAATTAEAGVPLN